MMKRGKWTFDEKLLLIRHENSYEVDLEDCTTCAQLADWIFQIAGKTWCSNADLGDLVRLIDKILAPQASLCSFGQEKGPIDVKKVVKLRKKMRVSDD